MRLTQIATAVCQIADCLLSFGAESFVFQVSIQKFKDQDMEILVNSEI
jgi:hypothetical protein